MKKVNEALAQAQEYSHIGLVFRSDAISWENASVISITDASFAQETVIDPDGQIKPHRTQHAFMNLL